MLYNKSCFIRSAILSSAVCFCTSALALSCPSMLALHASSSTDSIEFAWQNAISADNVYATVTLGGAEQTCEKIKDCTLSFTGLNPGTKYPYQLKLVNTSDNSQLTRTSSVSTLPLLSVNNIVATPATTDVNFSWHNSVSAADLPYVSSSIAINGKVSACNGAADCTADLSGLLPNSKYLYSISVIDQNAASNYSISGYVTTQAFPPVSITLKDIDERCSASSCTDVINYHISGGKPPYRMQLTSSTPALIADQEASNEDWIVQINRNTAYKIGFTATDSVGDVGHGSININSGY
jgi:hypothetical protein